MIAIDTNVLLRFLVRDDADQADAAKALMVTLSSQKPGFICREVIVEVVWVLERAYKFHRDKIADVLDMLLDTEAFVVESGEDVVRATHRYRNRDGDFSDLMIVAATERATGLPLYTFDRRLSRLEQVTLVGARK